MSETVSSTNLNNVCRFCLTNKHDLTPIAKHLELSYNKHCTANLDHIILVCIGVTVQPDDNFPKWICSQCIDQLIASYSFREKCLESVKYLEQTKVKEEPTLLQLDIDELEKTPDNLQDYDNKSDDSTCKDSVSFECLESESQGEELQKSQIHSTNRSGSASKYNSTFPYECDICGFHLKTLRTVAYHIKKVHIEKITNISTKKSDENAFECDEALL